MKTNSATLDSMLKHAQEMMTRSYAPYSNFHVGACIRTSKNNFYSGCNNENASYSLAQCAEATAIGVMISAGETQIAEIMIAAKCSEPCPPCGACRQRIREFAAGDTLIHMYNASNHNFLTMTLDELLPCSFGPQLLK